MDRVLVLVQLYKCDEFSFSNFFSRKIKDFHNDCIDKRKGTKKKKMDLLFMKDTFIKRKKERKKESYAECHSSMPVQKLCSREKKNRSWLSNNNENYTFLISSASCNLWAYIIEANSVHLSLKITCKIWKQNVKL